VHGARSVPTHMSKEQKMRCSVLESTQKPWQRTHSTRASSVAFSATPCFSIPHHTLVQPRLCFVSRAPTLSSERDAGETRAGGEKPGVGWGGLGWGGVFSP